MTLAQTQGRWRKSSHSQQEVNCVEVALEPGAAAVRDSKNPNGSPLVLSDTQWGAFINGVKAGQYDLA